MNGKTARMLRKYARGDREKYQNLKEVWNSLPEEAQFAIREVLRTLEDAQ